MHQFEACNREEIRCWSGNILVDCQARVCLAWVLTPVAASVRSLLFLGGSLIQSGIRNANARCPAAQNIICCPRRGRGNLFFVLLRGIAAPAARTANNVLGSR